MYEFRKPFSGTSIWRHDPKEWNGQKPKSARPYFFHPPKPAAQPCWKPISDAPTDNARPLYLARFLEGELKELDFNGGWESESESWEMPQVYYYWASENGIEEPTHWAYQDEPLPTSKPTAQPQVPDSDEFERLRKDAERYRYIREGGHWIVAATQTGCHIDGKVLDDLIDGEIADAMLKAKGEGK